MKRIEIDGHQVDIFDSIDDMPIARFHRFNRNLLVDSGVGGTVADVDRHLMRTIEFLKNKDNTSAIKELENLRQGVFLVEQGINPREYAFATLIKAIDGKDVDDLTDENLRNIMGQLGNMTVKELSQHIEEVKKKIDEEMNVYFPSIFRDSQKKEYYAKLKRLAMMKVDECLGLLEANPETYEKLSRELLTFSKPKDFSSDKSVEVTFDKEYENTCIVIGSELHLDAKKMSVMEYYHALEFLMDRAKKAEEARHKK